MASAYGPTSRRGEQCAPRAGREGERRTRAIGGVTHHDAVQPDTVRGVADFYAGPSVATAVSALAPVGAGTFHCSSATLAIVSRDASTGSAVVCNDLNTSIA